MESSQNRTSYRIAVIGANGGIGKCTVLSALKAGHSVTAILRTPAKLQIEHPNLEIVQGNILNPRGLDIYLANKDVVISTIGKNSLKKTTLYSEGSKNLIDILQRTGTARLFFISASGLEVNPTHSLIVRFATKFILQKLLANMYADLWKMEKTIKESGLAYTIIRPPKLTNEPEIGKYRIAIDDFINGGLKISRADVAHFMIHNFDNKDIIRKTVEIAY